MFPLPDRRNRVFQVCGEHPLTGHVAQERPHRRDRIATAGNGQLCRAQRDVGRHMLRADLRPVRIGVSKHMLDEAAHFPQVSNAGGASRNRERVPDTDRTAATGQHRVMLERRLAARRSTRGADPEAASRCTRAQRCHGAGNSENRCPPLHTPLPLAPPTECPSAMRGNAGARLTFASLYIEIPRIFAPLVSVAGAKKRAGSSFRRGTSAT